MVRPSGTASNRFSFEMTFPVPPSPRWSMTARLSFGFRSDRVLTGCGGYRSRRGPTRAPAAVLARFRRATSCSSRRRGSGARFPRLAGALATERLSHLLASTTSRGTPWPLSYSRPREYCARLSPCSAARRYHIAASVQFCGTPRPPVFKHEPEIGLPQRLFRQRDEFPRRRHIVLPVEGGNALP
jgi:hypothetical protein